MTTDFARAAASRLLSCAAAGGVYVGRGGAVVAPAPFEAAVDVAVEDADVTGKADRATRRAKGAADGHSKKRQKKDEKFGFGGKKRFSKSNDAKSSADASGYSAKKMKGGGKPRPGKSKRART